MSAEMGYNLRYKNMKEALILEHKTFISAKRASEIFGYASDYVGQLCRAGKLECKMVGRSWFVTEESIKKHQTLVAQDADQKTHEDIQPVPKKEETLVLEVPVIQAVAPVQVQPLVKSIFQPPARINYHVSFVPQVFALPYSISESYLFAPTHPKSKPFTFSFTKVSLGVAVFVISLFFIFPSFFNFNSFLKVTSIQSSASVISATQEIAGKIISFARGLFNSKGATVAKMENPSSGFNGLAVTPSSNSEAQDAVIKQKIRDSFSDEVQVKPDESGTAGIITPVFRKAKGDDFVYVLVPVNNQK